MAQGNFVFCTRHGMFDVRHYMLAGCLVMTAFLVLVSQSSLQASIVEPSARFTGLSDSTLQLPHKKPGSEKTARTKMTRPATRSANVTKFPLPENLKLTLFGTKKTDKSPQNLTRLASLRLDAPVTSFSPKKRKSCSLDAARAAANGDTSKISPCLQALLSGDEADLVNLPEKMGDFFIQAMNSENPGETLVNSMMAMMEAFSGGSDTPAKTATVSNEN